MLTVDEAARWTVQHRVEVDNRALLPGRVAVTGATPAARLAWQLAQLGAVVQIQRARPRLVDACRCCGRPDDLHCPGCGTCQPGYRCSLLCDADPEQLDAAIGRAEEWHDEIRVPC